MTIFRDLGRHQVVTHPFPFLVAEDVIDETLCDELIRTFPPLETITGGEQYGSNQKFHYRAYQSRTDPGLSRSWRKFIEQHLSGAALQDLIDVFRQSILLEYPDIENRFGILGSPRCGTRFQDQPTEYDVLLDAQMIVHTPVVGRPSAERGPHVKGASKLLEAYLFLRPARDISEGADLEIYSVEPGCNITFGERQVVDCDCLVREHTIPYRRNTLFVLLNTPRSIQAVSVRSPGSDPYMCFNVPVQLPEPLFALPQAN